MKLSGNKLVGSSPKNKRVENDFYATNPETVKKFFKEFAKKNTIGLDDVFWECACGRIRNGIRNRIFYGDISVSGLCKMAWKNW
jgi:hypothetical protein